MVWSGNQLAERCEQFGELLGAGEALWRPRAFHALQLPWERELPALSAALRALPLAQAEQLGADNDALLRWLAPFLPEAGALRRLGEPAPLPARDTGVWPEPRDVPGRKWAQIRAFVAALPAHSLPGLEWCAGKGHLGRHYCAVSGAAVTGLEWNAALVAEGNRLSARARLPVRLQQADVLAEQSAGQLDGAGQVLALHACGDLHLQLLRLCAQQPPRALALAPCCYHLTRADLYQPLSAPGRRQPLALAVIDLHTAVQESVTSPPRIQAQRRQMQAWRLGFDLLQRELRGIDDYLQTPSLPLSVLREGFPAFCRRLALLKQLVLPADVYYPRFEAAGLARLRQVAALDLPRLLFRRALELWLVLDRAQFLAERGFDVSLGIFCERRLTPRNLLILARSG